MDLRQDSILDDKVPCPFPPTLAMPGIANLFNVDDRRNQPQVPVWKHASEIE